MSALRAQKPPFVGALWAHFNVAVIALSCAYTVTQVRPAASTLRPDASILRPYWACSAPQIVAQLERSMGAVRAQYERKCAHTVLALCPYWLHCALMAQNGRKMGANRRKRGAKWAQWAQLGRAPSVLRTPLRYLAHVGRTRSAKWAHRGAFGSHLGRAR